MGESKRAKHSSPRSNLSAFGMWLYDLIDYLQVDLPTVARRAGLNGSTLSRAAKKGHVPEHETIERLEATLQDIAREKNFYWPASELEQPLYNSAGHATSGQTRKADQARRDIINEMVRRRDTLDQEKK